MPRVPSGRQTDAAAEHPAHLDSIRTDTCPGTGEPFRIAVTVTPEFQVVTA